jgi:hypothetical protein
MAIYASAQITCITSYTPDTIREDLQMYSRSCYVRQLSRNKHDVYFHMAVSSSTY